MAGQTGKDVNKDFVVEEIHGFYKRLAAYAHKHKLVGDEAFARIVQDGLYSFLWTLYEDRTIHILAQWIGMESRRQLEPASKDVDGDANDAKGK